MVGAKEPLNTAIDSAPWNDPPDLLTPEKNRVHLWRFRLDLPATEIESLHKLLSADEQRRAERLRDPEKSRNFIAAHGRLRQILAEYLHSPPATIRFDYGPAGKPFLADNSMLFFNLAHSRAWGLLGISDDGELGVDLEFLAKETDFQAIARKFFTAGEQSQLAGLPSAQQRQTFYQLWTAKEARLKAYGEGFSRPTDNPKPPLLVRHFQVAPDYLGAVATALKEWEMVCWDHQPPVQQVT